MNTTQTYIRSSSTILFFSLITLSVLKSSEICVVFKYGRWKRQKTDQLERFTRSPVQLLYTMTEVLVSDEIVERMSVLWVQKMYTYFRMFDEEGKGYFIKSEADEAFQKRALEFLPEEQMDACGKSGEELFEFLFRPASVTHGDRTIVFWGDFIEDRVECSTTVRRREDERSFRNMLTNYFQMIDVNKDGVLTASEVISVESIFGLTPKEARLDYVSMDKMCSGQVTLDVFLGNWVKWLYSTEWDDSTLSFGRLLSVGVHVTNPNSIKYRASVSQDIITDMGELWVRKMLTLFRHYDVEGSGALDWESVHNVTLKRTQNKFIKTVHEAIKKTNLEEKMYKYALEQAAIEDGAKKVVKWPEFLKHRYAAATENRPADEKLLVDLHETQNQAVDMNKDASIQLEEYMILAQIRGLTRHQSVVSFANIDINCDGNISYAEGLEAQRLFYYSKEWDVGTLLYGTLDNARIETS